MTFLEPYFGWRQISCGGWGWGQGWGEWDMLADFQHCLVQFPQTIEIPPNHARVPASTGFAFGHLIPKPMVLRFGIDMHVSSWGTDLFDPEST